MDTVIAVMALRVAKARMSLRSFIVARESSLKAAIYREPGLKVYCSSPALNYLTTLSSYCFLNSLW